MIHSILDTDLYKLTMQQMVFHHYAGTTVKYKFKCRNENTVFSLDCYKEIVDRIFALEHISLTESEEKYLSTLPYLAPDYISYLHDFRFLPHNHIDMSCKHGNLQITIEGQWIDTILYEVPILAIVNEVYFKHGGTFSKHIAKGKLESKIQIVESLLDPEFKFADFGTRRRFSREWQEQLLQILRTRLPNNFIGTSNIGLSKLLGTEPIGTMAHEYIQCHQAFAKSLAELQYSQKQALIHWRREYDNMLAIALTDTIGINAFLNDFDGFLARGYLGCRQDSGDPYKWCEKLIAHYEKLGIDPKTKLAVFSDGLTIPEAIRIFKTFKGRIKMSFGIGTNLTNDTGIPPLQIVMKVVECNGKPVAKISDSDGKQMCEDPAYIELLRKTFTQR